MKTLRCVALVALSALSPSLALSQTWTVAVDQTAASGTRSLRGLAVTDDVSSLYAGFIQSSTSAGARRYSLAGDPPVGTAQEDFNVTLESPSGSGHQAEACATDDRGWVYVASIKDSTSGDNARLFICDSTFSTIVRHVLPDIVTPGSTTGETVGGIDVVNDGGTYFLYVSRFSSDAYVERYEIGGASVAASTLTLDTSFNSGSGRFNIPGATAIRGIDVDAAGTMFIANRDPGTVWSVPSSLTGITSLALPRAMDVAEHDGKLYVSTYDGASSRVEEIDAATMTQTGNSWTATGTFPRGTSAGYSGIDIGSDNRIYVADQIYQVAGDDSDRVLVLSDVLTSSAAGWTAVADHPSAVGTRSLRGIALSTADNSVYGGFIQGSSTAGARRYSLAGHPPVGSTEEFFNVTAQPYPSAANHQAEAVTVDTRDWVYVASVKDSTSGDNARIYICDSTFASHTMVPLADIDFPGVVGETIGGVDVRQSGSDYLLYVTRFRSGSASPYIERYVVGGATPATATLTLDSTFNGTGRFSLPGGAFLRGIDVGADGTIFVASREDNRVWRIPSSLTGITNVTLTRAMDLAVDRGHLFVTTYDGVDSKVVEYVADTLAPTGRTFTATDTFPRGATEGYAGIDIDYRGRLYVADQIYGSNSDRILVSPPICPVNSYETVGAGCPGTGAVIPNIEAQFGSEPAVGATFAVDVTGMPVGGGMWWMVFGLSMEMDASGLILPFDLDVIGASGCFVRVDFLLVQAFAQAGGAAVYSISLPNLPELAGVTFFQQAYVQDIGANPLGLTVSNAKRACIGD